MLMNLPCNGQGGCHIIIFRVMDGHVLHDDIVEVNRYSVVVMTMVVAVQVLAVLMTMMTMVLMVFIAVKVMRS